MSCGEPSTWPVRVRSESPSSRRARPKSVMRGWSCGVNQDVGRLEVAVQNAVLVGVVDRLGNGLEISGRAAWPAAVRCPTNCARFCPSTKSIDEVMLALVDADFVDGDDVRMLQSRRRRRPRRGTAGRIPDCEPDRRQSS